METEADRELKDLKTRLRYITRMASAQHPQDHPTQALGEEVPLVPPQVPPEGGGAR